ncbi:hypothetical protein K9L97_00690 [Candidatus Woesearchaeota archaeon]|nr:hypothetical protein [Candidatus Woesearchaeota archaeon]
MGDKIYLSKKDNCEADIHVEKAIILAHEYHFKYPENYLGLLAWRPNPGVKEAIHISPILASVLDELSDFKEGTTRVKEQHEWNIESIKRESTANIEFGMMLDDFVNALYHKNEFVFLNHEIIFPVLSMEGLNKTLESKEDIYDNDIHYAQDYKYPTLKKELIKYLLNEILINGNTFEIDNFFYHPKKFEGKQIKFSWKWNGFFRSRHYG